jgi:hypothetical protein
MIRQLAHPLPPTPAPPSKLYRGQTGRLRKTNNLLTEAGEGGGQGAESYDRKKAFFALNESILIFVS